MTTSRPLLYFLATHKSTRTAMAGLLSQLVAFVRKNLCVLLVGVLALCYVYYNQGKSGMQNWSSAWSQIQAEEAQLAARLPGQEAAARANSAKAQAQMAAAAAAAAAKRKLAAAAKRKLDDPSGSDSDCTGDCV